MAGTRHRALLNKFALGSALALVIAPLVGVEQAEAACDATSPVSNTIITCTGTTTNAGGGGRGFGTGFDNGNTYNIQSGASINGDNLGLDLASGTVNISTGGSVIGGTGTNSVGVQTVGSDGLTLINAGHISGGAFGVNAVAGTQVPALTNQSGGRCMARSKA